MERKKMKISGIYKITNTITGDFYIGSSKNVKSRLANHKCPSTWKNNPNSPLYQDMKEYGVDSFAFEILTEVEPEHLKETEQKFIETLKPTYNDRNANGLDIERRKEYNIEYQKEYQKSDKRKKYQKEYQKSDKYKEHRKEYEKTEKRKDSRRKYNKKYKKKYNNQLCIYNGETLTLNALSIRFMRQGIPHPTQEAKKYLIKR